MAGLHRSSPAAAAASSSTRSGWRGLHPSTRIVAWQLGLIVLASAVLGALHHPLLLPYAWHKALHVLGAVLFLGNIIVTALWMSWMARSPHASTVHRAAQATNWADVAFTAPGIFLLLTNGMVLAEAMGGLAANPWALWGLVLFGVSGVIWFVLLVPAQEAMIRTSGQASASGSALSRAFHAALRRWSIAGMVAVVLPLIVLGLMVLRPGGA